jgi:hypothetical protein
MFFRFNFFGLSEKKSEALLKRLTIFQLELSKVFESFFELSKVLKSFLELSNVFKGFF